MTFHATLLFNTLKDVGAHCMNSFKSEVTEVAWILDIMILDVYSRQQQVGERYEDSRPWLQAIRVHLSITWCSIKIQISTIDFIKILIDFITENCKLKMLQSIHNFLIINSVSRIMICTFDHTAIQINFTAKRCYWCLKMTYTYWYSTMTMKFTY